MGRRLSGSQRPQPRRTGKDTRDWGVGYIFLLLSPEGFPSASLFLRRKPKEGHPWGLPLFLTTPRRLESD